MHYTGNAQDFWVRFRNHYFNSVTPNTQISALLYTDPYTPAEQEIFGKCLHQCSNHIHKNIILIVQVQVIVH